MDETEYTEDTDESFCPEEGCDCGLPKAEGVYDEGAVELTDSASALAKDKVYWQERLEKITAEIKETQANLATDPVTGSDWYLEPNAKFIWKTEPSTLAPDMVFIDNDTVPPENMPVARSKYKNAARKAPVIRPTCKYFAPDMYTAETYGAEIPEAWPYDKLLAHHGCMNPELNKIGQSVCSMYVSQADCNYYEPVPVTVLIRKKAIKGNKTTEVILERQTYGLSLPQFRVVTTTKNQEPQIVHQVDVNQHGSAAETVAKELYELTLSENYAKATIQDEPIAPPAAPVTPSYLTKLGAS